MLILFPAIWGINVLVKILLGITVTLNGATLSSTVAKATFLPIILAEKKSLIYLVDNYFALLWLSKHLIKISFNIFMA